MSNLAAMLRLPANLKSTQWQILAGPILILLILSMMVLPLPAFILDLLFTFNIALSIMVLLVAMFTQRTLEFAAFPTILLFTTLLRLALNVASTRIILMEGHTGAAAAGKVVEAFGHFLVGGNFAIGIVVFVILVIINFMVITKGAGRIAEVGARFVLDGMPGKQMAIDADLNAGLINQAQAQTRRKDVASEADFYGAMDGASKFVRGDAIAGMMILAINLIGGVCIGSFKYNLSADAAFQQYVLMTIGDGLVAQIPSLLLSTAAAIIVTRVSDNGDIAHDVRNQLLASPSVLYTATGIMFVLAVVPGMPHLPFLLFTALLGFTGWRMSKRPQAAEAEEKSLETLTRTMTETSEQQVSWETIPLIEPISLSLGYKLVALVDNAQGNPLTQRNRGERHEISAGNCVLMQETVVEPNANGEYVVTDKNVHITEDKKLAGTDTFPVFVAKGHSV